MNIKKIALTLVICLAAFLLLMTQRDALREHELYFTQNRSDVSFELSELSGEWTEKELRKRFAGLPIQCYPNPGDGLGDLGCTLDTKSYNGIPALFISFFFSSGKLQQVSINIPWWKHPEAYEYLTSKIGTPTASQTFPRSGVRLHGWRLPDGAGLFYNRDRSLNPLQWNAIFWRSPASCAGSACFNSRSDER